MSEKNGYISRFHSCDTAEKVNTIKTEYRSMVMRD